MTGHQLAMALRRAYLAMHRRTDALVGRHGVTADQFVLLSALAGGHAVTQRELADRTASDPNTVRAMLVLLENRGLIARTPHPSDGRAITVALTPAGKKSYRTLCSATEPVRVLLTQATAPDDPDGVLRLLERFTDTLTPAAGANPTPARKARP